MNMHNFESDITDRILKVDKDKFKVLALEIFEFQLSNNSIYAQWCKIFYGIDEHTVKNVESLTSLPFLPISQFKSHKISCFSDHELTFSSSGTTHQGVSSKHYIHRASDYKKSYLNGFEHAMKAQKFDVLMALLPSYLDRSDSGLINMVQGFLDEQVCGVAEGEFYNQNIDKFLADLENHTSLGKKVLVIGVTFALLQLIEKVTKPLIGVNILETGGMKGRGKELTRDELHELLSARLGVDPIWSEYGMTELTSQAYSLSAGQFFCPPWMQILIQDPSDPKNFMPIGKTGRICVIDLFNYHSCSFIATDDLGKVHDDGSFEVLGRLDYSDIRGCNLMIQ